MKLGIRRSRPTWRTADVQVLRPELWLIAVVAIGMLLVEVWQSSKVAELSLSLDHDRTVLEETRTRLGYLRAESERRIPRAELAPLARQLGLVPASPTQMVALPSVYLAEARPVETRPTRSLLAQAIERTSRFFVPEATARSRAAD
jgi:hypothetical protein